MGEMDPVAGPEDGEDLTELIRRLILGAVSHHTDPIDTARLAESVHEVADMLEEADAIPLASRYGAPGPGRFDPVSLFAFDPVFGRRNPVALPVIPRWEDPVAVAEATFTRVYEGPPDGVHGAVLAATFDQVCNVANIGAGVAGFTVDLEIRYRSLTRIEQPVRFEARIVSLEDERVVTEAHATQHGAITAEAVGTFHPLARR